MECARCKGAGRESIVVMPSGPTRVTLMRCAPFWVDNVYHHHNRNTRVSIYKCDEGHRWTVKVRQRCPAKGCDFAGFVRRTEAA